MKTLSNYINEQYINENRNMSLAEKMEILICFAHNSAFMSNDAKNMNYIINTCNISSDESYPLIKMFNDNKSTYLKMVEPLNKIYAGLKKLPDGACPITSEFLNAACYDYIPTTMPGKTDIISKDGKYRISVKKIGGAHLCSGSVHDTRGIMLTCADKLKTDEDREKLNALLNPEFWYENDNIYNTITDIVKDENHKLYNEIVNAKNINAKLQAEFTELFAKNPEFRKAVIREATTGEHKYGEGSAASANYVFTWDDKDPKNSHLETVDEFLRKFYNKLNIEVGTASSEPNKNEFRICFYSDYNKWTRKRSARTVFRIDYK